MLAFIQAVRNFFSLIGGIFLPMFHQGGRALSGVGKTVLWIFHFLLLIAVLGVLTYVNQKYFRTSLTDIPFVKDFWLPILFLAFYALVWLIWWLVQLLGMQPDASDFPDIDEAWADAVTALDKAGIGVADAPIFLVLGKPSAGEENLFAACGRRFTVQGAPNRNAPLHVYANKDEIYITCAGASLLGQQVSYLEGVVPAGANQPASYGGGEEEPSDGGKTLQAGALESTKKVREFMEEIRRQGRELYQLTPEEKATLKRLEGTSDDGSSARKTYIHSFPEEIRKFSSRLEHLCRLITADRAPYCPINGVLALLPLAGTDGRDEASSIGSCLNDDLRSARKVFRVNFPVLTLVCDLEKLTGFSEFISSMPRQQLRSRMGQRFPYIPDIKFDELPAMIQSGIQWIGLSSFPSLTYALLRIETPEKNDYTDAVRSNIRLFRFLTQIRERQDKLAHILTRGFASSEEGPPMFGGCYLAGTGRDAQSEQAFIAGVFERPVKDQELVSWTEDAIAEEASQAKWTSIGYGLIGLIVVAVIGGAFLYFKNRNA